MPTTRGHSLGQPLDGGHVDGRGEHGDVVQCHVDRRMIGNLFEVGVDARRAQLVVER